MNPIDTLLHHTSIREFKQQPIPPAHLDTLIDVAKHTASSTGMQTYSLIRITNPKVKSILAEEICLQPYIARIPEIFIFIVDAYRNSQIAREKGVELPSEADADRFFQGWTDAALAAQNMVGAAELAGYGTLYMGSILNNAPRLIELLELPKLTFPVVGVGMGVPNQKPQLKPRMPKSLNVFENTYTVFPDYMTAMEDYDAEMEEYYDLRDVNNRVDSFTTQVVKRLEGASALPLRGKLFEQIKAQGFTV